MSGTTPRFGLSWFNGDTQEGSLGDDGHKFTGDDRLLLDRLLSAIENHDHSDPSATDPSPTPAPPTLSLISGSGALESGKTYFYCVSFVDAHGTETPASDEVSIDTPDRLPAPDAPSAETDTSGTLPAGLYFYALTAVRGAEETPLGEPVAVTVLVGEGQVTLTLPPLGDATAFYVWRMNDADGQWARFSTTVSFGDFVDDGSEVPIPRSAPSTNTGTSDYSVSITLDVPDQSTVQNFAGWKIYRSTTSGTYGGNSLVEKVTTRVDQVDPGSPLVTSFEDTGDSLFPGSPPPINQGTKMNFVKQRIAIVTELPTDLSAYPEGFPLVLVDGSELKLHVLRSSAWEQVGGGGGGGGGGTFALGGTLPDPTAYAAGTGFVLVNAFGMHLYLTDGSAWAPVGESAPSSLVLSSSVWVGPTGAGHAEVDLPSGDGFFVPIPVERGASVSLLGVEVMTTTPGATVRLAAFAEGPGTGKPGVLLGDFGDVALDSSGWGVGGGPMLYAPTPRIWLFCSTLGTGDAHVRGVVDSSISLGVPAGSPASLASYGAWVATGLSSLPADASALSLALSDIVPMIRMRVVS